jgi:hypothetical protein
MLNRNENRLPPGGRTTEVKKPMRIAKLLAGAGLLVATALVGGTLIGGVMAAPGTTGSIDTDDEMQARGPFGDGEYCDVFVDTFAAELGVSRDDLLPASKAAALAAIDAAVADGDLDTDRADALRERIEAMDEAGCGLGFGMQLGFARGMALGHERGLMHADVVAAAAEALDLDSDALIEQMADGGSLEEIAEAEGVDYETVKAAVLAAVGADLEEAVADGLDQNRADAMLERISDWLDEGGERGVGRFGGAGGPGHRGGPWH